LSQILVTSGLTVNLAYGMGAYQQLFLDNAFGNYEQILTRVTLSPVMGEYLNMVNNDKPSSSVQPNENYARELLQLFSIGVWQLNQDGTQKQDAAGAPIPSYGQDEIEGFAHVFTGWTYPVLPGVPARTHNPKNYLGDMVPVDSNHDKGAKLLLNGAMLPAGGSIQADLTAAIHSVFMHPNVGPFIGKQLIQKLVAGDPSPRYVNRVAAIFNNNGQGVRGDLKAVVNAILNDPEARGFAKGNTAYGKCARTCPVHRGRSTNARHPERRRISGAADDSACQRLFYPASVFNYYPPRHRCLTPPTSRPSSPSRIRAPRSTATTLPIRFRLERSRHWRRSRVPSARRRTGLRSRHWRAIPMACSTS
jgi:uncharacterized protein (DUF1800 family)